MCESSKRLVFVMHSDALLCGIFACSLLPFRAMLETRAQLVAQRVREARAAGGSAAADEDGLITRTEAEVLRSYQNGPGPYYLPRAPRRLAYRCALHFWVCKSVGHPLTPKFKVLSKALLSPLRSIIWARTETL